MRALILFLLLPILCHCQESKNDKKIHGVSWVASPRIPDTQSITSVNQIKANWICHIPFGFARSNEPTVYFNSDRQWKGETTEGIAEAIRNSKDLGLSVALKPQIWIMNGVFTGRWGFDKEADWLVLEETYRNYILTFARIAQEESADLFIIGTELDEFAAARPTFWKKLILEVRAIYSGPLTYASNWDSYHKIPFWAELDYFGVDAYFPISMKNQPLLEDVEHSWNEIMFDLEKFIEPFSIPILFTEYGYRSVTGGLKEPWNSSNPGSYDPVAQELGFQGLYQSVWSRPTFAGGFLWKWFDRPERAGGEGNTGFTPQNKPSIETIRSYFDPND